MRCPHCGADNPIQKQYCVRCGKKMEVEFEVISEAVLVEAAVDETRKLTRWLPAVILLLFLLSVAVWLYASGLGKERQVEKLPLPSLLPPEPPMPETFQAELPPLPGLGEGEEPSLPEIRPGLSARLGFRREPIRSALHEAQGGTPPALEAVKSALACLSKHQDARTGAWSVDGQWERGKRKWGSPGVTGLAVLALLSDGHVWTDRKDKPAAAGKLASAAGRGVRFLVSSQDSSGRIGPATGNYMYNHGIGAAAICEAYAATGLAELKGPAERAVDFIAKAQRPNGGWDYTIDEGERSDISVTAWQVAALYSARLADLDVPEGTCARARKFVDDLTDPATGRTGYTKRPKPRAREVAQPTLSTTAMALACRLMLGEPPSSEMVRKQVAILLRPDILPAWKKEWRRGRTRASGEVFYYWYHGSLALRWVGGEAWRTWNGLVTKALLEGRNKDGSWPLVGQWARAGGKVYTTALAALTLQATYRYH